MYDNVFYNINESGADLPVKAGLSAPLLFLNYRLPVFKSSVQTCNITDISL